MNLNFDLLGRPDHYTLCLKIKTESTYQLISGWGNQDVPYQYYIPKPDNPFILDIPKFKSSYGYKGYKVPLSLNEALTDRIRSIDSTRSFEEMKYVVLMDRMSNPLAIKQFTTEEELAEILFKYFPK